MNKILTKTGLERVQKKLADLRKERSRLIIELEGARDQGDWTDNSALDSLKDQLALLENQLLELESFVDNAQVVECNNNKGVVGLGSKVKVAFNSSTKELEIVSDGQANPVKGEISYSSPLAQALLGKKRGQKVMVETPKGKVIYQILSIGD